MSRTRRGKRRMWRERKQTCLFLFQTLQSFLVASLFSTCQCFSTITCPLHLTWCDGQLQWISKEIIKSCFLLFLVSYAQHAPIMALPSMSSQSSVDRACSMFHITCSMIARLWVRFPPGLRFFSLTHPCDILIITSFSDPSSDKKLSCVQTLPALPIPSPTCHVYWCSSLVRPCTVSAVPLVSSACSVQHHTAMPNAQKQKH